MEIASLTPERIQITAQLQTEALEEVVGPIPGYPQTVRDIAREEGTALIDLHAMSRTFYRALGERLKSAFQDGTHHNAYGSYELAKCVALGIRQNQLPLAKFLVDDSATFDPAQPDPVEKFDLPASPRSSLAKPDGN